MQIEIGVLNLVFLIFHLGSKISASISDFTISGMARMITLYLKMFEWESEFSYFHCLAVSVLKKEESRTLQTSSNVLLLKVLSYLIYNCGAKKCSQEFSREVLQDEISKLTVDYMVFGVPNCDLFNQ